MSHLAPMQNGMFKYVCQLKRLTLNYCKWGGSSRGIREYIDRHVIQLAERNPQVTFYVRPRRYRHPRLVAEFLNGNSKIVSVRNFTSEEVADHVRRLCCSSGIKSEKLKKPWYTSNPSIQGNWTPFLHK